MNVTFWSVGMVCPYCQRVLQDGRGLFSHLLEFHVLGGTSDFENMILLNLLTMSQVNHEAIFNHMYQRVSPVLASCLNLVNLAEMLLKQNSSAGWLPDLSEKSLMVQTPILPHWFSIHDHVHTLTQSSLAGPTSGSFPCLPCYRSPPTIQSCGQSSDGTYSNRSSPLASSIATVDNEVILPSPHSMTAKPCKTYSSADTSRPKVSKSNDSLKQWLAMSLADAEFAATALVANAMLTPTRKSSKLWKSALESVKIMISHTKNQVLSRQCSKCQVVYTPNSYRNLHRCDVRNCIPERRKPRLILHMKSIRKAGGHAHLRNNLKQRISSYSSRRQVKGRST